MSKAHTKRIQAWQDNFRMASPFVIVCGIVAALYFAYRIALVAYPVAVLEQSVLHPIGSDAIVCSSEEGSTLDDPAPMLSSSYQKYIQDQHALTTNLVTNSTLDAQANSQPIGYEHSIENATSNYQYLQDISDNKLFLRVTDTSTDTSANRMPPAWLTDPVDIATNATYAYTLQYRSNVPVQIAIEHSKPGGGLSYQGVVTLKPSESWQSFTAHFNNTDGFSSFRIIATGASSGYVDTRGFDIHQIPDADLKKGIASITFDDGWKSVTSNALPLLNKYHIRTTQYIISDVAAHNVPEYMDLSEVSRLKQAGHEIGSHSLTHCNQTKLSNDAIRDNAVRSKQILEQQKLGPIKSFAYPLGQYNETTQNIYSKQYAYIRTSDFGYNDRYFDVTNVHSMGVLSSTKDSELKSWLAYAAVHRLWLVIVYHRVNESGDYNVTTMQLDRQLNMIAKSGLTLLPLGVAGDYVRSH